MADEEKVIVTKSKLDALATSISTKSGESLPMTIAQMKSAVDGISGSGSSVNLGTKSIVENGTYTALNDNLDGYSSVTVNVPIPVPNLQSKTATPTESIQTITADSTYDGLSSVEIGAIDSEYIGSEVTRISNNSGITINGNTVSVAGQAYWTGNISKTIPLQSKTATPTESTQTITADSDYSGLSSVEIGAVSSTYVGSEITRRSSSNLTASGSTVTVPAGYYAESASKSVTTVTHANPTASINSTTGLITASHTQTAGYVNAGTTTDTLQLTTQDAKTVTPTELSQTAVAAGVYTTGTVTIGAISSTYVGSGITQRDGDDLIVSEATVTVPAGYYSSQTTKSVVSGSTGTPTATKGTVSNHSITVTPSVTNTTGYITGGTKTGTAITVTASELASGNKEIISNGTNIDVVGYSTVSVAIPPNEPNLQTKTDIVPSTSSQTITPDNGYDGLSSVQIDAMPNGSASTPATTITANPSISVNTSGLITATTSVSQEIIPTVSAGYISAGTSGTVTVSGSNTQQLTTLGATTYNTSTTDQTITSGKYITGTQTIKAVTVSGLSAENIANGVTVKVGDANDDDRIVSVTGTLAFQTIHTGSSTPSSSLGNNGDIYIQS